MRKIPVAERSEGGAGGEGCWQQEVRGKLYKAREKFSLISGRTKLKWKNWKKKKLKGVQIWNDPIPISSLFHHSRTAKISATREERQQSLIFVPLNERPWIVQFDVVFIITIQRRKTKLRIYKFSRIRPKFCSNNNEVFKGAKIALQKTFQN